MVRKRKATTPIYTDYTTNIPSKRPENKHTVQSSEDERETGSDGGSLEEDEFYINCILDETESQYLIDWEGDYTPTWEPKEHANDSAVQAWEERKQQGRSQKETPLNTPPPESLLLSPREHSTERLDPAPVSPGIESQHTCSSSPLFVPAASIPETYLSPGDPASANSTSFSLLNPYESANDIESDLEETSLEAQPVIAGVFELSSASSIPAQLRLPDEIEETPIRSVYARITPDKEKNNISEADGLVISGRIDELPLPKSPGLSGLRNPQESLPNNEVQADSEIPETPSALLGEPKSPRSRIIPATGSHHSFTSSICRSIPDTTAVSQLHSSIVCSTPGHPITRRASTVAETVIAITPHTPANAEFQGSASGSMTIGPDPGVDIYAMDDQDKKGGTTLSDVMDKYSQFEGSTPKEKLMNAYAQLRTSKSNPTPDASATPSSAGDIEPSAPVPVPETAPPLSVRVDKEPTHHAHPEPAPTMPVAPVEPVGMEPPQHIDMQHTGIQTIQPSALTVMHTEEPIPGAVHLGPSEFAIPLPMDSRVKDDYEKVLTSESQSIRNFLNITSAPSKIPEDQHEHLVSTMNGVLERLNNVTTHPDLNTLDHAKASDSDVEKEAAWAEYSSAKFQLISYLLEIARMRDMHLIIMVHGEKTQRVVERYLLGKSLTYTRPRQEMGSGTNAEVSLIKGPLSFGVQSTANDGVMETYKAPSAIIAFDSLFNVKNPTVEHMRTTFARNGNLLPVIRLMVSNSSEHIGLCFPGLPELERLRLIIQYTIRLRSSVGDLQDDALGVHEDAEELLSCLESDNANAHWSLPHIESLDIVSPEELEATQHELQSRPSVDVSSLMTSQTQKRAFEEDITEQSSKRPRVEESQDSSQFTESTNFPSQTLNGGLRSLERNVVQMKTAHAAEVDRLQKALAEAQARLQERDSVLEKLQHRYETRTKDSHQLQRERERLAEAKATSDQKLEKQKEDIAKLKDERTQLRHELEQARESLKAGGGSSAELESAREEIRRLNEENASFKRKAEYEARQAEYTREQYQTASTVAAQSGNEARQLREENENLTRKVAGDASRLRELNMKNDEARHLSRVVELESLLRSREDLLRRKEEEVRELRKNRPSTRSTSTQPRSPKWTAGNSRPTSPGINNNSNNNGSSLAGRGSTLRYSEVR
ncbi:hypothetical protein BO70DRAFT_51891 [Aspergillus heteromorphus CBS 117.55]|uniref:HDA1 complex subunit n=1 Tax=Aspergillus heteromorphus CBS 117.55 TaxID=1448321 RepID=A0A317W0W9_9EURO|nr:uncharacterized protein BO70DRAFT_51891 [Aspergillus heteromorphus CBS 117.55]PWY79635.1 hypothetical protein BO70DRAFT_51891 [Aspergillus heteromorphus CBS 117.55]